MIIEMNEDCIINYPIKKIKIQEYYNKLISCDKERNQLIQLLESYESSFIDFNEIQIISFQKEEKIIKMLIKIIDLLNYSHFYYKTIYLKNIEYYSI